MVMKKKVVEVSFSLSYEDRKKFVDFYTILMVVDRRLQAKKKEAKNKKKIVKAKARDPCGLYFLKILCFPPSLLLLDHT